MPLERSILFSSARPVEREVGEVSYPGPHDVWGHQNAPFTKIRKFSPHSDPVRMFPQAPLWLSTSIPVVCTQSPVTNVTIHNSILSLLSEAFISKFLSALAVISYATTNEETIIAHNTTVRISGLRSCQFSSFRIRTATKNCAISKSTVFRSFFILKPVSKQQNSNRKRNGMDGINRLLNQEKLIEPQSRKKI